MDAILRGILDGTDKTEVDEILCALIKKGNNGEMAEDLLEKGKLKQPLSKYKVLSGASAGAAWAKVNLGRDYEVDESFLTAINKRGEWMGFDSLQSIEGVAEVDWAGLTEKYIVNKACHIYDLVDWDVQPLWNAHLGLSETRWL